MKQTEKSLSDQLRVAMRAWASGVTILTAAHQSVQHGMTVSSFTSVSMTPPQIIVALKNATRTHHLVSQSGAFAVTVLAENQQVISNRFAGQIPDGEDRMAGIEIEILVSEAPFIKGGLAYFDCQVIQAIPVGENTLFLAEIVTARGTTQGLPLIYYNSDYQQLVSNIFDQGRQNDRR